MTTASSNEIQEEEISEHVHDQMETNQFHDLTIKNSWPHEKLFSYSIKHCFLSHMKCAHKPASITFNLESYNPLRKCRT